jgi:hypothetical protein
VVAADADGDGCAVAGGVERRAVSMSRLREVIVWRSAADELPDEECTVLICIGGVVGEGFIEEGAWNWASGGGFNGVPMWAPMPEGVETV